MLAVAVFRSQSAPLKQERFRLIAEFYQEFLVGKVVENHPYPDFGLVLEHADLAPAILMPLFATSPRYAQVGTASAPIFTGRRPSAISTFSTRASMDLV
jgi:hypothetical protein